MSTTHSPVECGDCGSAIDVSADPPEGRAPCPKCGSKKRAYYATMANAQPTDYMLDHFVAHKLSQLTECGAAELPEKSSWLNAFILNNLFMVNFPLKTRAYLFNFLRRAEGALSGYREARLALINYVNTPRSTIYPYFKALSLFEICVSQCYQGYELLATASGERFFEQGDGSAAERLQKLYVDSKHMDCMIDGEKVPLEATVPLWITNSGLESGRAALSFLELEEILLNMYTLAEKVSMLD